MTKAPLHIRVEYLPLAELVPYARNSRTHSDEQVAQIAASVRAFGFTNPVLVSEAGDIIAGHGRVKAATKLGMTEVPCIRLGHLSETQRKAYVIADNRLALNAGWDTAMLSLELAELKLEDFDLDLLGFDEGEVDALLNPEVAEGNTDPDEVPENAETRCKPGDLWILGGHRLLCGDSTNVQHVERLMGGEKADLWLTDPPYGVDIKQVSIDRYEKTGRGGTQAGHKEIANDIAGADGWKEVLRDAFCNAHIATTNKASHYVFTCQGSDKQMMMMMMMMQESGWNFRHEIIWLKNRFILGRSDYHYQHEPCLYGWKTEGTHEWFGERDKASVLAFDVSKNDLHPTMKPVGLAEQLITNSSRHGGKVLDTFCGSGTTLIACEKTGRRCFGMELDPKYCDVILARWEAFSGQEAHLD